MIRVLPVQVMAQPNSDTNSSEHLPPADDEPSAERLWGIVYNQLRAAAQLQLNNERASHTLSATAMVHEAYLKLEQQRAVDWKNRAHFYAAAVEAMRRLLIDHARHKAAKKRGGAEARKAALELSSLPDLGSEEQSAGFLILDEAILRLGELDAQAAAVVRLRYFAGLTIEQTAETLGISSPTVKRIWSFARGWLKEHIESGRI